jgi:hypothetical protein
MAGHRERFRRLAAAIRGERVEPVKSKTKGPINYELMDRATAAIVDPTQQNLDRFELLLRAQEEVGHLSRRAPDYVSEQGSPGMHWTYNCASVAGVVFSRVEEDDKPWTGCRGAGVRWLANEAGLNREYRYNGEVWLPASRVKDEKEQAGHDGYRDIWTALASGEKVKKPEKYWSDPQALAVRVMRDLLPRLTSDERELIRTAGVPKLLLAINKVELPGGGFLAYFEDNEFNRKILGKDACNWVLIGPGGGECGLDWEPLPEVEVA